MKKHPHLTLRQNYTNGIIYDFINNMSHMIIKNNKIYHDTLMYNDYYPVLSIEDYENKKEIFVEKYNITLEVKYKSDSLYIYTRTTKNNTLFASHGSFTNLSTIDKLIHLHAK